MKLVVVTSRCPISHEKVAGRETVRVNVGGVATALHQALKNHGGSWICWGDGNSDRDHEEEEYEGYRIVRVFLDRAEKHGFYDEYSNGTLWPLFHYFRERIRYAEGSFQQYSRVNQKFAETIIRKSDPESLVWVHDYQLTLVPGMLRKSGFSNFIIFTWHIPWVSSEFFNILPQAREIAGSLLQSNMITFHTELYRKNFRESCERVADPEMSVDDMTFAYSLGIDYKHYSDDTQIKQARFAPAERKIIFSIDRLDYTKGLINRLLAVERYTKLYPQSRGKFLYIMIVTPSRTAVFEYQKMRRDIEMEVGRINGILGDINWQPVIYMYRKVAERALLSYYRNADVALITPVMDGLNLVSKEFVAATQKGVLILSEFAGSAFNLPQAILVNPNDIDAMAHALARALSMGPEEALQRLKAMKTSIRRRDINWWINAIEKKADELMHKGRPDYVSGN